MTWQSYELGNTISKATRDTRLWQSEKGIIETNKNTLAIPIKLDDQEKGYIFHGHGKLLLDTIVETEEGAIGKPVEKELTKPFLMLANIEETQRHLSEATGEDLAKIGYKEQQTLIDNAKDMLNRFFKRGRIHSQHCFNQDESFIFAFKNQTDKLDILVASGPKFVYTSKDVVFVSNKNNVVLKSTDEVVCSSNGKSVIISKGKRIIIKK